MAAKGFVIRCNNCGSELTISTDNDFYNKQFDENSKVKLYVIWNYEEGSFECQCGNVVEF